MPFWHAIVPFWKSANETSNGDLGFQIWDLGFRIYERRLKTCTRLTPTINNYHPETLVSGVILRSKATKNLVVTGIAEILREVYPESIEGLRMTLSSLRMETNYLSQAVSRRRYMITHQ